MNQATVQALAQVGGLAIQALIEYLRTVPHDEAEPGAREAATMALMDHAQALGDALKADLNARPEPTAQVETPTTRQGVYEAPAATPSAQAHEVEPPGLVQTGLDDNAHDARRALAATIWGEARSEPLSGRIAVGWVVRNRAADPGWWGRDVLTCCISPGQFSCWWDKQGQNVRLADETDQQFRQALQIAGEVMTGDLADPTGGADHYHRDDVMPYWAEGRTPIRMIGRHMFYRIGRGGRSA